MPDSPDPRTDELQRLRDAMADATHGIAIEAIPRGTTAQAYRKAVLRRLYTAFDAALVTSPDPREREEPRAMEKVGCQKSPTRRHDFYVMRPTDRPADACRWCQKVVPVASGVALTEAVPSATPATQAEDDRLAPSYAAGQGELRRLAEAATPGPWRYGWSDGSGKVTLGQDGGTITLPGDTLTTGQEIVAGGRDSWGIRVGVVREADAAYIAAVSPDVLLRLLERPSA